MTIYVKDIVYAACIVIIMAWTIYKETKEQRGRANGLAPNPERCQQHGEALARLETRVNSIEGDIVEIKETLKGK